MACSFAEAGKNKFYVGMVKHSWLQVLGELIAETPDSVLAQELWLAAASVGLRPALASDLFGRPASGFGFRLLPPACVRLWLPAGSNIELAN